MYSKSVAERNRFSFVKQNFEGSRKTRTPTRLHTTVYRPSESEGNTDQWTKHDCLMTGPKARTNLWVGYYLWRKLINRISLQKRFVGCYDTPKTGRGNAELNNIYESHNQCRCCNDASTPTVQSSAAQVGYWPWRGPRNSPALKRVSFRATTFLLFQTFPRIPPCLSSFSWHSHLPTSFQSCHTEISS